MLFVSSWPNRLVYNIITVAPIDGSPLFNHLKYQKDYSPYEFLQPS